LADVASVLRDQGFRNTVTYSRKVFIPLTHLCRDVCHYCTFAQVPRKVMAPYMSIDEVLEVARHGAAMGCKEALFTLGEKPELRYKAARDALAEMGYESTTDYLFAAAKAVFEETGMLPHLNPGNLEPEELARLKTVSPSMGIMLESASERLCEKGMPHYGSPDKVPAVRLQTLANAGIAQVPFTTGILIGIGETRLERIESLLAIRAIHEQYGHVQEIIVQNFRAKPETKMVNAPEPDLNELLWTIAIARLIFGPTMSVQAPPNLSPGVLPQIVHAGINDWGGVSPVTPDFVNPEAPWPHLDELARETASAGKFLTERLTMYPDYAVDLDRWAHPDLHVRMLEMIDAEGFPRIDEWCPGDVDIAPPSEVMNAIVNAPRHVSADIAALLDKASAGETLDEAEIIRLFQSRGDDFTAVVQRADALRAQTNGNSVSFVVNRNINYTNICYFKCQFCAFSKGKLSENLRGRPYDLSDEEIARRTTEAWERGATEVCMQGGIHPEYTGETYINIVRTVKSAQPNMHVHAFSPLEVWQGAATLKMDIGEYLQQLKDVGLNTLPGTAAEILDDEVRDIICADKINTQQWLDVMEAAHSVGYKTTATIMYGHVEKLEHWARHIMRVRELQERTGGFTEFVPLPFVHMEAPMYLKGKARKGPTFREAILMHSVARLALHGQIDNIQTSWVKMGHEGVKACMNAGCNDLGGTLMNESISRAAGTQHGQETNPRQMGNLIRRLNRDPQQRSTSYGKVSDERIKAGLAQGELLEIINTPAEKYERKTPSAQLIRNPAPSRASLADRSGG
jgi:FO synthase